MRLIDADALEPDADYDDGEFWAYSIGQVDSAHTIEPEQRWIPCSERLPDEKDAGILKKLGIEKKVRGCPCHSRGQGRKNDRDSLYV